MVAKFVRWAELESRCTSQFVNHLRQLDGTEPEGNRASDWESSFPVHCLLRFHDEELPAWVKGEEARKSRREIATKTQRSAREYLERQRLPYESLWLINALSVHLCRQNLLSHLTELAARHHEVLWFDYVPPCYHADPFGLAPQTLDEIGNNVLDRIEREMGTWAGPQTVYPPEAMLPGLNDAILLRELDGAGVRIAIVDTGVDPQHPDLAGRINVPDELDGVSSSERVLAEVRPGERYSQSFKIDNPRAMEVTLDVCFGLRRPGAGPFFQQPLEPQLKVQIVPEEGQSFSVPLVRNPQFNVKNAKTAQQRYFSRQFPVTQNATYRIELTCSHADGIFPWRRALVQMEARYSDGNNANVGAVSFSGGEDDWGHGTRMAGIIAGTGAASAGEFRGIAPRARLLSLKVVQASAIGQPQDRLTNALNWLGTRDDIRLVNISLGSAPDCDQRKVPCPVCLEVDRLVHELNKIVVVSAGNRGANITTCPAKASRAIVVGSVGWTEPRKVSTFSGFDGAGRPDVVVLGENIAAPLARFANSRMTNRNGELRVEFPRGLATNGAYTWATGTSASTAAVTGLIARLLQRRAELSAAEVRNLLKSSSRPVVLPAGMAAAGMIDFDLLANQLPEIQIERANASVPTGSSIVTVEAKIKNHSALLLRKVDITWLLRGRDGSPIATVSSSEFDLTAGSDETKLETVALPANYQATDVRDVVCAVRGESEWCDDPVAPDVRVIDASERDRRTIALEIK